MAEAVRVERTTRAGRAGLALGVLGLLALVALGARNRGWGGGSGGTSGLPLSFWDTVFSVLAVFFLVGVVIAIWMYAQIRGARGAGGYERRLHLLAAVFFIATVIGLALAYQHWGRGHARLLHRPAQVQTGANGHQDTLPTRRPGPAQQHHFNWGAAAGTLALVIGLTALIVVRERRLKRKPKVPRRVAVEALAAAIDDSLEGLRREPDPRKAVIAAYARMERALGAHGLPRDPSEAPHEYLARVLAELDASAGSVSRLTDLFERAKFSPHLVDLAMKEEAIDALVRLRDELVQREEPALATA
jgi:uncharacterized protein DUF4129